MELNLRDRTIWIESKSADLSLELARACLEEGARCAMFGASLGSRVAGLRRRYGFRVFCQPHEAAVPSETKRAALQWGGLPARLIIHLPRGLMPAEVEVWLAPLLAHAEGDTSVVLLRDDSTIAPEGGTTETLRARLSHDVGAAVRLAGDRLSVSALGCTLARGGGEAGRTRLADDAAVALVLFLLSRGSPQIMVVGPEGLVEMD